MARQIILEAISAGAKRVAEIDCRKDLAPDELLTGAVTATEDGTSDLVLDDKAVSTAVLTIKNKSVPIGKAFVFSVEALNAVEGTTYHIAVVVSTDGPIAQRLTYDVVLPCA
jgi:hypothetical protein